MKKFLLSEGDRNELRRLLSAARSAPAPTVLRDVSRKTFFEGDTYWALPPCETGLPAAEFVGDQWTSYGIKCCLFKKDAFTNKMEPLLDAVGNPARATVWNHYGNSEMGLVQVHKHKEGFWTNERPFGTNQGDNNSLVTTTPNPSAGCTGKCIWTANADGVWQWPTGGCSPSSTTSTTTITPGPGTGSTVPPLGIPTTGVPCQEAPPCYLVCVDTSTTPAPDEYGVPVPYTRFRYEMKVGSSCPAGCKCYGLGDPCFLVAGELKSTCIGDTAATSTTTATPGSTPPPDAYPCAEAEFIFGTVPPNIRRIAYKINGDVEPCQECSDPKADINSPGAVPYRQHDWRKLSTVYESPCVDSPCTFVESDGLPLFTAFRYDDQINLWGSVNNPAVYDNSPGLPAPRFLANWFSCEVSNSNRRPNRVPPLWIYDVDENVSDLNTSRGITIENGVHVFRTIWAEGLSCTNCGRAPAVLSRNPTVFEPGGSTTSTTTSTTTTLGPCGCVRPLFCPQPFECVKTACIRGGEVVGGTPGTTKIPSAPCFPDSTTTTVSPSTTNGPNQCIGAGGRLCICTSTSTTTVAPPPCGPGRECPPGYVARGGSFFGGAEDPCVPCECVLSCIGDLGFRPECGTTRTPPPYDLCVGSCTWKSAYNYSAGTGFEWFFDFQTGCFGGFGCGCFRPDTVPAECNLTAVTGCVRYESSTTPAPDPCACCNPTTTGSPCGVRTCRYRATAELNWVLVTNSCILNCPCPNPAGLPPPLEECESLSFLCGATLPPPPSTSPPTTNNPCLCGVTNCGCSTGGVIYCNPGQTYDCVRCLCVSTTSAPTTTTATPTTTFTPCGGANCGATNCGCSEGYTWYCVGTGEVYDCSVCGCVTTTTTTPAPTTTPASTTTGAPPVTTTIE